MEERLSMVTTECEKVQIITAITSVQTLRHGRQRKKTTRTLSVTNEHQNFWCLWDPGCPVTPRLPGVPHASQGGPMSRRFCETWDHAGSHGRNNPHASR